MQCAYYQPKCNYLNIGSGQGVTIKELVVFKFHCKFEYEFDLTKSMVFKK